MPATAILRKPLFHHIPGLDQRVHQDPVPFRRAVRVAHNGPVATDAPSRATALPAPSASTNRSRLRSVSRTRYGPTDPSSPKGKARPDPSVSQGNDGLAIGTVSPGKSPPSGHPTSGHRVDKVPGTLSPHQRPEPGAGPSRSSSPMTSKRLPSGDRATAQMMPSTRQSGWTSPSTTRYVTTAIFHRSCRPPVSLRTSARRLPSGCQACARTSKSPSVNPSGLSAPASSRKRPTCRQWWGFESMPSYRFLMRA